MPLHLAPLTRRDFLRRSALAGAAVLTLPAFRARAAAPNPHRWALLSDPHIAGDPATIARECNMAERLGAVITEIGQLNAQPAGVFVNGDCSLDRGLADDYITFASVVTPLRAAGAPLHLTLGNHDERDVFWSTLKDTRPASPPLMSKHVSIVEGARANWFLLDSLEVTKQTPGSLGEEQRAWLARALDAHTSKPALIMVHHNPVSGDPAKKTGLTDTEELLAILLPREHVKALFFGHTHTWRVTEREGLHLVNLPAIGYPFKPTEVTGWVDCNLRETGAALELRALDASHPEHGKLTDLAWRSA